MFRKIKARFIRLLFGDLKQKSDFSEDFLNRAREAMERFSKERQNKGLGTGVTLGDVIDKLKNLT